MAFARRLLFSATAVKSCRPSLSACSNKWIPSIHLPSSYSTQERLISSLQVASSKSLQPKSTCITPSSRRWWSSDRQDDELPWTDIVTDQLLSMLKDNNIQLIDVRELPELEENGRIPQTIHVPREQTIKMLLAVSNVFLFNSG